MMYRAKECLHNYRCVPRKFRSYTHILYTYYVCVCQLNGSNISGYTNITDRKNWVTEFLSREPKYRQFS